MPCIMIRHSYRGGKYFSALLPLAWTPPEQQTGLPNKSCRTYGCVSGPRGSASAIEAFTPCECLPKICGCSMYTLELRCMPADR